MSSAPGQSTGVRAREPKAIHSALVVLEEVARCGPGVTAQELSASLGLPRATTYRLLNLLVQEEYLVRLPDLSGFALGSKVARLARRADPGRPPLAAREVIENVRRGIRGGVHLVRYDDLRLMIVDADPDFPLSNPSRITRFLDASAMGRLLLPELSDVGLLPSVAVERSAAEVAGFVAETRLRGYAVQVGEFRREHGCLAVPIRDSAGSLIGGLCVSTSRTRIEHPGELLETLRINSLLLAPLLA